MSEKRKMTCILCPVGCEITVETDGEQIINIDGNTCLRGKKYAAEEITDPRRTLTTTVRVSGGEAPVASVKSADALPKDKLIPSMGVIAKAAAKAPLKVGDVVIKNILDTGVDIVATCSVDKV